MIVFGAKKCPNSDLHYGDENIIEMYLIVMKIM